MMYSLLAAAILALGSVQAALPAIEIKGNAFYSGSTRFYIRGVDYQPGGSSNASDPLADATSCKRDVAYFKDLGLNTIRVYTVDNSADHDECMSALDAAGIYLLLDVNTPKQSLNRADPKNSYNAAYLQAVFATIDAFKKYDNVLGFFSGNEVINDANSTGTAPYVKAVTRDMKKYIAQQSKRKIPVGYSAADISQNRWQQMSYFNCGGNATTIDMFGMNDYSWCGDSSFTVSGYSQNVENYKNYSIPMFFSEYGCNKVRPRKFSEVGTIYSDQMSSVYSGGLVYEYAQDSSNNYGLVDIDGDSVKKLPDYANFKNALSKAQNPSGDGGASTKPKSNCPTYQEGVWEVRDNKIPDTPKAAEKYFSKGAGKPLGLSAPSTQWGGSDTSKGDNDGGSQSASPSSSGTSSSGGSKASASSTSGSKKNASSSTIDLNKIWGLMIGGVVGIFVLTV